MPVKDSDLLTIAQFENLERLELNFSNITAKGLLALNKLTHLKSISLSGTQVNYQDLQIAMQGLKKLQAIYLWDTPLTADDLKALTAKFKSIQIIGGFKDDGKNPLRLNPPELKIHRPFLTRRRHSPYSIRLRALRYVIRWMEHLSTALNLPFSMEMF